MRKIVANLTSREKRYAVLENSQVVKIEIMPPNQSSAVGNIYMGKVTKVLPGMDAVFVDYGENKNGLLHRDDLPTFQLASNKSGTVNQYIRQGEKLLVQVKRDETGTKGAKLSGLIELSTESLVYIYGIDYVGVSKKFQDRNKQKYWRELANEYKTQEEGLIVRTAMENQSEEYFFNKVRSLRTMYLDLQKKGKEFKHQGVILQKDTFIEMLLSEMSNGVSGEIIVDDFSVYQQLDQSSQQGELNWTVTYEPGQMNIFSRHHIDIELEHALKKVVWLENGGYLIIEETEALTVIDVNTGKFVGKEKKEETLFKTNLLAAAEVAHQLRLRNIAGIVLVDFVNMDNPKHKKEIIELMKTETAQDEMRVHVIGFTQLGILELTRKRTSPALSEIVLMKCPACGGSGKVVSPETVAFRLERELLEHRKNDEEAVWVEANRAVANLLLGEKESYRPVLEEAIAKKLILTITNQMSNQYEIKRFGSYQDILEASRTNDKNE